MQLGHQPSPVLRSRGSLRGTASFWAAFGGSPQGALFLTRCICCGLCPHQASVSLLHTKEHRPLMRPPCAGDCVDAECPEFIGFVDSPGLPVSRAQQPLGTLHRLGLLCPIFRLYFSGSNFYKNVHRYLQRPFIQTHTRRIFVQASAFCICHFEGKERDRPKYVADTKELKQWGATCFIYFSCHHCLLLLLLVASHLLPVSQ